MALTFYAVDGGFVFSSHGSWRPGVYESPAAVAAAESLTDEAINRLQHDAHRNAGGVDTEIGMGILEGVITLDQVIAEKGKT